MGLCPLQNLLHNGCLYNFSVTSGQELTEIILNVVLVYGKLKHWKIFHQFYNFCDIQCLSVHEVPLEMGSTLNRKKFVPQKNSFLLEKTPNDKEDKNMFDPVTTLASLSIPVWLPVDVTLTVSAGTYGTTIYWLSAYSEQPLYQEHWTNSWRWQTNMLYHKKTSIFFKTSVLNIKSSCWFF